MDGVISASNYESNKLKLDEMTEQCLQERYSFIASHTWAYTIIALYWIAIIIGPKIMDNRKTFQLTAIIKVYNIIQLIYNSYMVFLYFQLMGISQGLKFWENSCYPVMSANKFQESVLCGRLIPLILLYVTNKVLDLAETIFFILRKKQSQISFLHVFHHTALVVLGKICLHYGKEEVSVILAFLNSSVHVVMYLYYFLASLGPSVQKLLWWKRYITRIQIIQFVCMLTLLAKMVFYDGCEVNKVFLASWSITVAIFLYLFADFYHKAYSKKLK